MDSFTKKEQIVILVIVFTILTSFGYMYISRLNRNSDIGIINIHQDHDEVEEKEEINQMIMVHISGQVYNPGVIELPLGSRVIDAINMAGGLKKLGDSDRINLARKLADEEKIFVPKIGEDFPEEVLASNNNSSGSGNNKININTCDKSQLISLPGIGDALATRIMDYRSTTPFKTIDDIKNVSGIGEKKFEGIKELIIVK